MKKKPDHLSIPLGKIIPWDKNPRNIKKEKLRLLADYLTKYGQFSNLTCWPVGDSPDEYPQEDTGKYQTGGGNMRWNAMIHILKWSNDKQIQISLNYPENEAERIELSLLDNMGFGVYEEDKLAELASPYTGILNFSDLEVNIEEPLKMDALMEKFSPVGIDEQGRLDQLAEKVKVQCPECGCEFIP